MNLLIKGFPDDLNTDLKVLAAKLNKSKGGLIIGLLSAGIIGRTLINVPLTPGCTDIGE